jgi:protein-L-isoaspartate(D-aspartate) O-methyltransferase
LKQGDGSLGWEEYAPYDGIIITATAPRVPEQLLPQLKMNSIMVLPLGKSYHNLQQLVKIKKTREGLIQETLYAVRFVPMTGMVRD